MKSDQKTIRQRVEEILSLRLLGALPTDIRRHGEEQGWNVSERQLQRYTAQADELLAQAVEKNKDKLFAHHFAARRALYARAMAVSDYATARQVLKDEAELLGLYPGKKMELTGPNGGPLQTAVLELSDDERRDALTALYAHVGKTNGVSHPPEAELTGHSMGQAGNVADDSRHDPGFLANRIAPLFE